MAFRRKTGKGPRDKGGGEYSALHLIVIISPTNFCIVTKREEERKYMHQALKRQEI